MLGFRRERDWSRLSDHIERGVSAPGARVSIRGRCRANMAYIRQSRPDSGLGFQVKVVEAFQLVLSSLGSGWL